MSRSVNKYVIDYPTYVLFIYLFVNFSNEILFYILSIMIFQINKILYLSIFSIVILLLRKCLQNSRLNITIQTVSIVVTILCNK